MARCMNSLIRPTLLIIGIYSLLLWAYVILRILAINDPGVWAAEFIGGIPISFWQLGAVAFVTSAGAMWGWMVTK